MSRQVLIVEDEQDIADILDYNFRKEGFQTRVANSGQEGLDMAREEPIPDVVLLDLMLPDIPGTEVCRSLKADERTRDIPILMVTARTDEIDRIVGFELGADDYIAKPFSVREVVLRVRAVMRRRQGTVEEKAEVLSFGQLRVDPEAHRVWVVDTEVELTALEFRLLVTFMERPGRVQSRDTLLDDVWGYDKDVTTRTVDTHVKRLREKLGTAGTHIQTVRGVGYRFRDSL